jgi:methyltransferase (TIGR00027 family)
MPQKRIEAQISRTAEICCLCRGVSSLEKDPLFRSDDRLAVSLMPDFLRILVRIPGAGRLFIRAFAAKGIYEYIIARTKYIDSVFRRAPSGGFEQILIFGAGFDTRALRFREELQRIRVFELDAPVTLEAKIAQYRKRRLEAPPNLVFAPINFDKESIPEKLEQAGFRRGVKTLFLLEGVLEYLQPGSVDRTFQTIRDFAGEGSEIVFNYAYASVIRGENTHYGEKGALETLSRVGESWFFGIEKEAINAFLAKYGFKVLDQRDAGDLEEMYFKDPSGRIAARVNGAHCLVRAVENQP